MIRAALRRLLLSLGLLLVGPVSADTISLRADEWYPFNGQPGGERPGFMIEIAREVLGKAGHSIDYALMPWERALDSVRKGEHDCVVGASPGDAPDFVFPEEPMGMDASVFFVKKGNPWRYSGVESLPSIRLGVIAGYAYGDVLDAYIERGGAAVQPVSGAAALEQNLRKLQAGRLDAVVESAAVLAGKAHELGLDGAFEPAGSPDEPEPVYVACSPAKPAAREYARLLTEGMRALRASGALATILSRYGVADWK
jgi:polar amino acid transport system substrate-binding protein